MNARRILVHTDFTDASIASVQFARILADGLGATLQFLHVMQGPFEAGWTAEVSAAALPRVQEAMQVEAEQWIDAVLPESEQDRFQAGLDFETGDIASEIARYVEQHPVDIVVISATAGSKSNEVTNLTVAEDVLRKCRCSVFVVR